MPSRDPIGSRPKESVFAQSYKLFPERLRILSEGDSWFSYPLNNNLADFIEMMNAFSMLRLEKNGDQARDILAPNSSQLRKLRTFLKRYAFDLLIFSGGGNDIVDENLPAFLKRKTAAMTWRQCIRDDALAKRMQELAAAYSRLIGSRDELRPTCEIVTHSYDYPIPDGRPARGPFGLGSAGPWLKPALDDARITDPADAQAVVRHLIDTFHATLAGLVTPANKFHVVDMRGTLGPQGVRAWADEIHPSFPGFQALSEKWRARLLALFPGRGFERV
jgi:lysophospholipase L1-like esterase